MSAEAFLEWAEVQGSGRYQLIGGQIVAMAPERLEHVHVKYHAAKALEAGIDAAKLPCRIFTDGASVKIDAGTVFEPDALVNCGPPPPRGSLIAPNPVIVVDVISPASVARDARRRDMRTLSGIPACSIISSCLSRTGSRCCTAAAKARH